jgi:hypothetical protein
VNTTLPRTPLRVALALLTFLVAATGPYAWLIEHFGYDDILREPTAVILTRFQAGGSAVVLAWLAFALSALLFIPVVLAIDRLPGGGRGAAVLGMASAVAQATGLLRWVLVVPALAATQADPHSSMAVLAVNTAVFDVVHRYGGMVLGEMVGQLLLAGWTAMVAQQLWRQALVPRWLAALGALTLPLWLLGQTELVHGVVPQVPAIEVIPLAFMAWEAWLALLAVAFLRGAWRRRRARPCDPAAAG